jgi:hypothetical protein
MWEIIALQLVLDAINERCLNNEILGRRVRRLEVRVIAKHRKLRAGR